MVDRSRGGGDGVMIKEIINILKEFKNEELDGINKYLKFINYVQNSNLDIEVKEYIIDKINDITEDEINHIKKLRRLIDVI